MTNQITILIFYLNQNFAKDLLISLKIFLNFFNLILNFYYNIIHYCSCSEFNYHQFLAIHINGNTFNKN